MKHRKLRIAWWIVCGIACVLLVLLWVRSYSIRDSTYWPTSKLEMEFNSMKGHFVLFLAFRPSPEGEVRFNHAMITPDDEARVKHGILGFFYFRGEDTAGVHVPFWFLALAVMAAAVVIPWIWPRQFSLRTLLIATTLVAAVLGLVVWLSRTQ
jgi:hypothetical protein